MKRWAAALAHPHDEPGQEPAHTIHVYADDARDALASAAARAPYGTAPVGVSRAPQGPRETLSEILRASKAATEAPWIFTPDRVDDDGSDYVPSTLHADVLVPGPDVVEGGEIHLAWNISREDGEFMARTRESAPATARSLLRTMEAAEAMAASDSPELQQAGKAIFAIINEELAPLS